MSILSVKNLEKKFGDLTVLKDISFNINDGEIISIIGSSGSGKSTLLRCMNQLETITSGTITIDGKTLVVDPYCYYLNKKGAFLFEYNSAGSWKYSDYQRVN